MLKPIKEPMDEPARVTACPTNPILSTSRVSTGTFPPGVEVPPLLIDFAGWPEGRPWGSVGCFSRPFSGDAPARTMGAGLARYWLR